MNPKPPRLVLQFFRWFCRRDLRYHIEGDLLEFFYENVEKKGIKQAQRIFTSEVLKLFRPRMIRFLYSGLKLNFLGMSKLNFLVAIRRLYRNRTHSLINISGLTIGLVSIMLMLLYINYETSYDSFNPNIYRVETEFKSEKILETWDNTPYPLANELVATVPEIKSAVNLRKTADYLVLGEQVVHEKHGLFADNGFLQIFEIELLEGDQTTALQNPSSIVLSKTLAHKYFPNGQYLGKTINLNKELDVVVTGVYEDYRHNSHLVMDYILSFSTITRLHNYNLNTWDSRGSVCYIQLQSNASASLVDDRISKFLEKHIEPNSYQTETLSLRPLSDVYLDTSKVRGGIGKGSTKTIIYLFYIVLIFTSLITALNYMNSTSAELINRELEIGIKKVMGGSRGSFAIQFMIEGLLVAIVGFVLALGLTFLILPYYNLIVNRPLELDFLNSSGFIGQVLLFALLGGIITGVYPTLYLSALKISALIQGNSSLRRKSISRKVLVTFQLFIAMPLIFTSILISEQISFLETRDIGFDRFDLARTYVTLGSGDSDQKLKSIKQEILTNSNIKSASLSGSGPYFGSDPLQVEWQNNNETEHVKLRIHRVDTDFMETYGFELVAGRSFDKSFSTDISNGIIINETTKEYFNWDEAIGKQLKSGNATYHVIGVVKDFNDFTMFKKIPPMGLVVRNQGLNYSLISVKVSGNREETISYLNNTFNNAFPNEPIQFELLEDNFDRSYIETLGNVSKMFVFFSVLAIFLAALGLYSLVSHSTKMQQKMIAIRKVLGAGVSNLFSLLLKEYLILYSIAAVLGLITTYVVALKVINVFAYHTTVKVSYLLIGGGIALAVVLVSVSAKILFTARANPVDSIGKE